MLDFLQHFLVQLHIESTTEIILLLLTFILGGIVRGFAGFGFTLIVLPLAALVLLLRPLCPH